MDDTNLTPHFHMSPKILQSISTIYTDPTHVFMEFVDNLFDSAEAYWNGQKGRYDRAVNIMVRMAGGWNHWIRRHYRRLRRNLELPQGG